jgi:hypothetical protein
MDIKNIIKNIEEQFVSDYEEIRIFMDDVNLTLDKINIDFRYESYDEFCLDIEQNIIDIIKEQNSTNISTSLIVKALNNLVKYRILQDDNYEQKIIDYFDDPDSILMDIKK